MQHGQLMLEYVKFKVSVYTKLYLKISYLLYLLNKIERKKQKRN